jgi:hypothetical protein
MSESKTDWKKLRLEYVHGRMSLAQLARTRKISLSTLKQHSARGGWAEARKAHKAQIDARRTDAARQQSMQSAEAEGQSIAEQNCQLATEFFALALESAKGARLASEPKDRRDLAVAAGVGVDKWRLVTEQVTGRVHRENGLRDLTDDEIVDELEEAALIARARADDGSRGEKPVVSAGNGT